MGRMSGKVAVVTGAAQGIGRVYAEALAANGARVVVTDIEDTGGAVSAIEAEGGEAIGMPTDVTSDDSLEEMVKETESTFGPIEVLVNNAAVFAALTMKPFTQIPNDEWDLVMRVNVRGAVPGGKSRGSQYEKERARQDRQYLVGHGTSRCAHVSSLRVLQKARSLPRLGRSVGNSPPTIST